MDKSQDLWAQLDENAYWNGMGGPEEDDTGAPLVEGGNPAWNPFLEYVPEDKRTEAVGVLKQWDENYTKLNESYTPWKSYADQGVTPDAVEEALRFVNLIENQPQVVHQKLQEYMEKNGLLPQNTPPASQPTGGKKVEEDTPPNEQQDVWSDPRFQTLQQQADTLAQIALAQKKSEEERALQAEQDKALEQELKGLKDKYGDFPDNEILMRMHYNGGDAEKAYEEYSSLVSQAQRRRPAPSLVGHGGVVGGQRPDPRKMNDEQRQSYIAQIINNANQER